MPSQQMLIPVASNEVCSVDHNQKITVDYEFSETPVSEIKYFRRSFKCPDDKRSSIILTFGLRSEFDVKITKVDNDSWISVAVGGLDAAVAEDPEYIVFDFVVDR